jgi:hypothetical protein
MRQILRGSRTLNIKETNKNWILRTVVKVKLHAPTTPAEI